MEVFYTVTPMMVLMQCDKCLKGFLQPTGKKIGTDQDASFEHLCNNPACVTAKWFRGVQYPQFRNVVSAEPMDPQPKF